MKIYEHATDILKLAFAGKPAFAALAVAMLVLTGCFKPMTQDGSGKGNEADASFYIGEAKGAAFPAENMPGFSIPVSRTFNFNVCEIKNRRSMEDIKGHKFVIQGAGLEPVTATSDNKGCVQWSEKIGYDFLGEEKYLPLTRKISAQGIESGTREIKLAINPWLLAKGAEPVFDLRFHKVQHLVPEGEVLDRLSGKATKAKRPLVIKELRSQNYALKSPDGVGLSREFGIQFVPTLQMNDMNGNRVFVELKDAKMKVQVALVVKVIIAGNEKMYKEVSLSEPLEVTRDGTLFRAQMPVKILNGNQGSRYLVALRVYLDGGPVAVSAGELLAEIGSFEEISGQQKLSTLIKLTSTDHAFDLEKFLDQIGTLPGSVAERTPDAPNGASTGTPLGPDAQPSKQPPGPPAPDQKQPPVAQNPNRPVVPMPEGMTKASPFKLSSLAVLKGQEVGSPTRRTVTYTVQACLRDMTNHALPPIGVVFQVTNTKGETKPITASKADTHPGCLGWTESLDYKPYEPERFLERSFTIKHVASGWTLTRKIALNPWDAFRTFKDMEDDAVVDLVNAVSNKKLIPTVLVGRSINFATPTKREFYVDEFLNMTILKPIRLEIPLVTVRASNLMQAASFAPENLNTGRYLLKAALHLRTKDAAGDTKDLITPLIWGPHAGKQIVNVIDGAIRQDLYFPITDLLFTRARVNLVLQVLPVDQEKSAPDKVAGVADLETLVDTESGLVSPVFVTPLWLAETGGQILVPADQIDGNLSEAVIKFQKVQPPAEVLKDLHPLHNVKIDALIAQAAKDQREYRRRMAQHMWLPNVLARGHLDYVPLYNEEKLYQDFSLTSSLQRPDAPVPGARRELKDNNVALPKTGAASHLLKFLNTKFKRGMRTLYSVTLQDIELKEPITRESLSDFLEGKRELDKPMAYRLCHMFMNDLLPRQVPWGSFGPRHDGLSIWFDDCATQVQIHGIDRVFNVERTMRVFETDHVARFVGGCQLGISVGATIAYARAQSESTSMTLGWDPVAMLGGVAKAAKPMSLLSAVPGALGVSATFSYTSSDSKSLTRDSAFQMNTSLDLDKTEIDVKFKKYENCAAIRMNPTFWESQMTMLKLMSKTWTDQQKAKLAEAISRGIMLCDGHVAVDRSQPAKPGEELKPKSIIMREHFFAIAQSWLTGTQNDPGDTKNLPWLLGMRGARDFTAFMTFIVGTKDVRRIPKQIEATTLPLERMNESYQRYRAWSPTEPGVYSYDSQQMAGTAFTCTAISR